MKYPLVPSCPILIEVGQRMKVALADYDGTTWQAFGSDRLASVITAALIYWDTPQDTNPVCGRLRS